MGEGFLPMGAIRSVANRGPGRIGPRAHDMGLYDRAAEFASGNQTGDVAREGAGFAHGDRRQSPLAPLR